MSSSFRPDTCSDQDRLGFDQYIQTLSRMIKDPDFKTPFCIGIYGEWGSGKTNFMRLLSDRLRGVLPEDRLGHEEIVKKLAAAKIIEKSEKQPTLVSFNEENRSVEEITMALQNAGITAEVEKNRIIDLWWEFKLDGEPYVIPVWFNPWRYAKEEHLIIPFLKTIEDAINVYAQSRQSIKDTLKKTLINAAENIGIIAAAFAYCAELDFKFLKLRFDKTLDKAEKLTQQKAEKEKPLHEQLSSNYYDILSRLKENIKERSFRVAVFIDDLDRCLPEKALELLESIKLFLDLEGYLFVIGVDKEVVEKGIAYHYRHLDYKPGGPMSPEEKKDSGGNNAFSSGIKSQDYLDKMIQFPLKLPLVDDERKISYIESLVTGDFKQYAKLIKTGVGGNPRSIKRFINLLAFMSRHADTLKINIKKNNAETSEHKEWIERYFNPLLYIKWSLIVFKFPVEHSSIAGNYKNLIAFQQAALKDAEPSEQKEEQGGPRIDETLREILREGDRDKEEDFFPDNRWVILRFVHLAETTQIKEEGKASGASYDFKPGSMVKIPKEDSFLYGEKKKEESLDYDYEIDVFPVTNRQYKEFLDDNPKQEEPFVEEDWAKRYNWNERSYPEGRENHPVVLVSWHDAVAYCKWKTEKDKDGYIYKLPSEKEWEKAARGADGRKYPWGEGFDKEKCNTGESGIGETTEVTKYPQGASPYQCREMAGNVWEWTRTDDNTGKDCEGLENFIPVLRGGSWGYDQVDARCASRSYSSPDSRGAVIGFRCLRTFITL